MHFDDLSPYQYGGETPTPSIVNVGWLAEGKPFETGPVPDRFLEALQALVASPVNLYRGSHTCEFCPPPPPGRAWYSKDAAGNGEIRVLGADGRTFVAPVMVLHYIEKHGYKPPDDFILAVAR